MHYLDCKSRLPLTAATQQMWLEPGLTLYAFHAGDKRLDEWVSASQLQPLLANQQSLPLSHSHSLPAV